MKKKRVLTAVLAMILTLATGLSAVSVMVVASAAADQSAVSAPDLTDPKYTVMPDTWVFTDALGRTALTNAEVGDLKYDKTLAMFYWTWHIKSNSMSNNPFNLNEFIEEHPEAKNDLNHPGWTSQGPARCYWNEPLFGYYLGTDEWVLRRHAEMLANAGVDTIFTDNTNGILTWKDGYDALFEAWTESLEDGVNTPKVSFMLPFAGNENAKTQLHALYDDIYSQSKYQDLWFYWEDKPMLMAWGNCLDMTDAKERGMYNFFTFRHNRAEYIHPGSSSDIREWGWLSLYPQHYYYGDRANMANKIVEQVTVGVAINHSYVTNQGTAMNGENVIGRSYTSAVGEGKIPYPTDPNAKLYGYHFAEQFDYALELDPKVVFVTGWNEWIAGRHQEWGGVVNAFPDEFNDEYSRDLEPSRGDLGDNYYYQLVNYSRQFKGARPIPTPSLATTIDIKGDLSQWNAVEPFYAAYQGNTYERDSEGCGDTYYTDFSGRNDIIGSQVARDDDMVYFLVECADVITPYTDPLWMTLYIDCNQENQGWETFDYVINKTSPSATHAALERFTDGYATEMVGQVEYTVNGRYMQVAVPKSMLGLEGNNFTINFSWTDNVHDWNDRGVLNPADGSMIYSEFSGDILDFYTSGDVAPGMRFKYSYVSTDGNSYEQTETETETETESTAETVVATDETTVPADETTEAADLTETEAAPAGCKSSFVGLLPAAAVTLGGACLLARRRKRE